MLGQVWRCSWSSVDKRYYNYIWVIQKFIAYYGATYIRGFKVISSLVVHKPNTNAVAMQQWGIVGACKLGNTGQYRASKEHGSTAMTTW